MASDDLIGVQDDNNSISSLRSTIPSASSDTSFLPPSPSLHATSPTANQGYLFPPPPTLRPARNSLDVIGSSALGVSEPSSSQPPPSPTLSAHSSGSIRFVNSTALRDNHPEDHDGLSTLYLAPPPRGHRRKPSIGTVSSIASSSTERDGEDSSSVPLTPMPSTHSDATSILPSPTYTHVEVASDAGSRPPSATGFFRRTLHRVRHPSPSPSRETDTGSDTTRNDGQRGDNADVKRNGPQLARPVVLDLKQETDLNVHPFAFKPLQLASLVDPKSLETLEGMGGVNALLRGLGTHPTRGLTIKAGIASSHHRSPDPNFPGPKEYRVTDTDKDPPKPDITITVSVRLGDALGVSLSAAPQFSEDTYGMSVEDRQRIFGRNVIPPRPSKTLLKIMWLALQDKVLIILEFTILVAVLIVVLVGSLNDWQKEKQFKALNEKKDERLVRVVRDDREQLIDAHDVVVGDVVRLESGDIIPSDGVFLSGHNVRCDESGASGESDMIKKLSYQECIALRDRRLAEFDPDSSVGDAESTRGSQRNIKVSGLDLLGHTDCFLVSGSKVSEGIGSYLVIAVGTKSFHGRVMMALRGDSENTPLQVKLNRLAEVIAKIGSIASALLFVFLLIRFIVEVATNNPQRTSSEKGSLFVQILVIAVTIVVVAVPEGLPLAVTLALAFATKRMANENLLVRVLGSCETMANASVICTDKTGTLTQNEMSVVAGSVGVHVKFVRNLEEHPTRAGNEARGGSNARDWAIDLSDLNAALSPQLVELFNASIAINSTAFEDVDPETGAPMFVGSKTETALLKFAKTLGWANYKVTRDAANLIQMIPFSSNRKSMGCVVRLPDGIHRLYIKGASEILTRKCIRRVVVYRERANDIPGVSEVETATIREPEEDNILRTITFYASQALRTIALCYRDFRHWPPRNAQLMDDGEVDYNDLAVDLTLIGIVGIEDPLREGVRQAVIKCKMSGVHVTMCTGDNVLTARSIAQQCNIYTSGGVIMEGPHFRALPPNVMKAIVPRLQVLARSSPDDKRLLVEALKERGNIVGVTGDGTNDGPALKTADVGFSMGIAGTEVAKEASDIVLMDDNFSSIVKAIMWGRCVNDAVRKFLQFQLTTNVTAVVITFITAISSSGEQGALSAVQLLWINLIMDTFAALALATDPASEVLLNRKPAKKTDPLFTVDMLKQIVGQSTYQIIVILIFNYFGSRILGFHHVNDSTRKKRNDAIVQTLVFNAYVFAQICNSFNSRRLDKNLNVFEGVLKNWYFMAISSIEIAVQVLICFVGGAAFQVARMGGREWAISLALGAVSIPLGAVIRLIPNKPCERVFQKVRLLPKPEAEAPPTIFPDAEPGFSFAQEQVRDNLSTFAKLRGGRMRGSSFVGKSRSAGPESEHPHVVSGLLAVFPTLVTSHFVASSTWQPRTMGSLSDPAGFDPSRSSADLWENQFEVHPDTPRDDPVFKILGAASRPLTPR
ncbi:calcium-translocating P-type ATPase [Russula earlei]|uniref:Calcium-translocating P-type ATPase n=1 Tax=Russula earlei TaxID=71964 RepID=A0ACC0U2W0_9AGAM|nr:calcium-translocating P-type ATPase [Russula earlei]